MTTRKGIAISVALVGALALIGFGTCGIVQLRMCAEARDVSRGALKYRLCGISKEPIAMMPLAAIVTEPRFAWRLADGNKPGWHSLKYETSRPDDVTTTLTQYLRSVGFSPHPGETRAGHPWWTDGRAEVGIAIRPAVGGHALVEVIYDGGLE